MSVTPFLINSSGTSLGRSFCTVSPVPFGGALYQAVTDQAVSSTDNTAGKLAVYKSVDGGATWNPEDYSNAPAYGANAGGEGVQTVVSADWNPAFATNKLFLLHWDNPRANLYVTVFTMRGASLAGSYGSPSAAGPAVNITLPPPYSTGSTAEDVDIRMRSDGTCFVTYSRTAPIVTTQRQFSLWDSIGNVWSSVDSLLADKPYASQTGPNIEQALLMDGNDRATELYYDGQDPLLWLNWRAGVQHGPTLVPSGGVAQTDIRNLGIYRPGSDEVIFPLAYSGIWALRGSPSANPTSWVFEEPIAALGSSLFYAGMALGPNNADMAEFWLEWTGSASLINYSLNTGSGWGPKITACNLTAVAGWGNEVWNGCNCRRLNATDVGVTIGGPQVVSSVRYAKCGYFIYVPNVFSAPPAGYISGKGNITLG